MIEIGNIIYYKVFGISRTKRFFYMIYDKNLDKCIYFRAPDICLIYNNDYVKEISLPVPKLKESYYEEIIQQFKQPVTSFYTTIWLSNDNDIVLFNEMITYIKKYKRLNKISKII